MTGTASGARGGSLARQLRRLFGNADDAAPTTQPRDDRPDAALLSRLEARLDQIERTLADLAARPAPGDGGIEALAAALTALEKQIGRAGREQLQANALAETQQARLDAALDALRAADARREAELGGVRDAARAAQTTARLDVVRAILPALDGLGEAARSGRQLLERPVPPASWFARLSGPAQSRPPDSALRDDMAAWLTGLDFVRQRLLDALAAEGVRPMDAEGQPFDPRYHVALEVVPADPSHPPGTVVAELRRGYLAGDRPLRYAEVAVSGAGARGAR